MIPSSLYHYGVKGQKWGVIRTPAQLGHAPKKSKKKKRSVVTSTKKNTTKKNTTKKKTKSISEMTDEEIRQRINRLSLENDLRRLQPRQQTSRGRAFVNTIAKDMALPAAKEIGTQLIKSGMAQALNKALDLEKTPYQLYTNNQKKK